MDWLTAAFFEDSEIDGISGAEEAHSSLGAQTPHRPSIPCGRVVPDSSDDTDHGIEETDGFKPTIQDKIRGGNLTPKQLREFSKDHISELDHRDEKGMALIHHLSISNVDYIGDLLLTLFVYGNPNIDVPAKDGKTALTLAVQAGNLEMVRALLAIGATLGDPSLTFAKELRSRGRQLLEKEDFTDSGEAEDFVKTKKHVGHLLNQSRSKSNIAEMIYRLLKIISVNTAAIQKGCALQPPVVNYDHVAKTYTKLKKSLESKKREYRDHQVPDKATSVMKAMQTLEEYGQTNGVKILCLDGGGIRGLVQLELLRQIESRTGKSITHLFDWIVGSSTGGIIALALVYGELSISELQRFYLRLKRDVFSGSGYLKKGDSQQLEKYLQQKLLKGNCKRMCDKDQPKVLVSAVEQKDSDIHLRFFNNCFEDDEYQNEEVWKVGRYTSAAPLFFTPVDNYLDGCLLAFNPTEDALSAIQEHYSKRGLHLPISLVVSLGSGENPPSLGKNTNITQEVAIAALPNARPFINLLVRALEKQSSEVKSKTRCQEQGIKYIRLNPTLHEEIDTDEKDNKKLISMLLTTRRYMQHPQEEGRQRMDTLVEFLRQE